MTERGLTKHQRFLFNVYKRFFYIFVTFIYVFLTFFIFFLERFFTSMLLISFIVIHHNSGERKVTERKKMQRQNENETQEDT